MSAQAFISIGSNIDAEYNIRSCLDALHRHFKPLQLSNFYESEAVGMEGDNFINLVAAFSTELGVHELNHALHQIELQHGRRRDQPRFSPRSLDLDLLLYDDLVLDEHGLVLPRDEITRYAFVLLPLSELAPDRIHPILHQTIADLWRAFDDPSQALWVIPFDWKVTE